MSFTDTFSTPPDLGEPRASELSSSLGEQLGAEASEAFMGGTRQLLRSSQYLGARTGVDPLAAMGAADAGMAGAQVYSDAMADQAAQPDVPIADAKARVKQEGLEGQIKLPDQDTMRGPVLDMMIQDAHERQQYAAAVNRGPQNFAAGALGFLTSIGAGMIDPVNAAAFSIPVIGEAKYGMLLARAGDSVAARAALRTGVGAAQGFVGGAALVPADWWLHTQDGQDYTFADALKSVVLSAGMGAAAHGGLGAAGDLLSRLRGAPLSGSIEDLRARALAGDTHAADIVEKLGSAGVHLPEEALEPGGVNTDQVPGISSGLANVDQPVTAPVHPAEVLADLPPPAREDVTRAAIADVIKGEPVQAGELLQEAGKADPRIAESIEAWHGSPHDFDQFDSGKIGEGEGAQSYGHGLYFAEHPDVAANYAERLGAGADVVSSKAYDDPELGPKLHASEGEQDRLDSEIARAQAAGPHRTDKESLGELQKSKGDELRRIYGNVHTNIATPAERAAVEADGVSWKGYTDEIDGYLSKIEHEKAVNPPTEPLHVDPDAAIGHHQSSNKKEPAGAEPTLPAARAKPAKAKAPQSLMQFLAEKGGISDKDPLVSDLLQSFGGKNPSVPGYGKLVRPGGKPLDRAREAAVEAGYLHDEAIQTGGVTESTINHLLDAIDDEARGTKHYPAGSEGVQSKEVLEAQGEQSRADRERFVAGAHADLERLMDQWGVTSLRKFIERKAFDYMDSEHMDAETALERAVSDFSKTDRGAPADAGRADWDSLKRTPQPDDELVDASREADKAPAPPETPEKAVSAAQKAAAEADKLLADILPTLSDAERKTFEDALADLQHDTETREQIVRDGAACLAAASVEIAA